MAVLGIAATGATADASEPMLVPIENVRVGDRVLTARMRGTESETDVGADWIEIDLEMAESLMAVTLLRPPTWLQSADPDDDAVVELSLDELSLSGSAHIVNVRPNSGVAPGAGRVVLATVQHHSEVLALRFGGEEIRATANHPFYSADRHAWVAAGHLREDEHVEAAHSSRLRSAVALPGRVSVYNLQVELESEYLVGASLLRVHNTYPKDFKPLSQYIADDIGALGLPRGARMSARRAAFQLIDRIGRLTGRVSEGMLRVHFPNSDVHMLRQNFRGWISIDLLPGARSSFGGGRLLVRPTERGVEFMVRNTHR